MTQSPSRFIFWDNLHAGVRVVSQLITSLDVSYYHGPVAHIGVPVSVPSHICVFHFWDSLHVYNYSRPL
jgi:hypothetical protein